GGAANLDQAFQNEVPTDATFCRLQQLCLELLALVASVEAREVALEGLALALQVGSQVLEQRLLAAPHQAGWQVERGARRQLVDELGATLLVAGARQVGSDALLDPFLDLLPRLETELLGELLARLGPLFRLHVVNLDMQRSLGRFAC